MALSKGTTTTLDTFASAFETMLVVILFKTFIKMYCDSLLYQ